MARQPNILFFFPDQQRPDWLGGDNPEIPLRTPNVDRLRQLGTTFTRAYSPSPLCAPCRAALAAGKSYDRCRVPDNNHNYPLDQPTYYQALRDAGYRVAGVGKFDLHKDTSDFTNMFWNLDGSRLLDEWGFTEGVDNEGKLDGSGSYKKGGAPRGPYLNFLEKQGLAEQYVAEHGETAPKYKDAYVTALPDDAYCDNWLSDNGLELLEKFPQGQPWHLVINFTGPHNPMDVTQSMHESVKDVSFPPPHANEQTDYTADDHQRNRRHYAAMIENIDRQVGRFLDKLEERGELDNTIVVYASDHGEMLGDHGLWGKSVYYEPSLRIPLVICGPGFRENVESDALVSLHDLAATLVEAAGAEPMPGMDARSLMPVLQGHSDQHREVVVGGLNHWRAAVNHRFKLVDGLEESPILYDLYEDPWEDVNVVEQYPEQAVYLRRWMEAETARAHSG